MRIATWNVNGLRARLDFILHWLESRQPDVVGMQELKVTDDEFPMESFNAVGYEVVTHGQKGWNGVAIAARQPVEVEVRGLPGQDEAGARLVQARVADVSFATVYCPNGKDIDHDDFPRKLAWYDSLAEYLAGVDPNTPFVVGGDFNVCPDPIDCWRGEAADGTIFCTTEERSRFQGLPRWWFGRPTSSYPTRRTGLLLVGLSRRGVPSRHGFANRHAARHCAGGATRARSHG